MTRPATLSDLHDALAWRLRGLDQENAQNAAGAIYSLVHVGEGSPLRENALAVILESCGVVPAGNVATLSQALLALGAERAGDLHTFYPAAFVVLEARRQSQRAQGGRHGDALDAMLRGLIAKHPDFGAPMIWAELARQASGRIDDGALVSYDSLADTLAFEPHPGAEIRDIGFEAFRRRFHRIKKSLRHKLAAVSPVHETAQNQPRLAA